MRAYRITHDTDPDGVYFCTTRADAHQGAKERYFRHQWGTVYIDLVEFPIDQKSICKLLNQQPPELTVLRTWRLTNHGDLEDLL